MSDEVEQAEELDSWIIPDTYSADGGTIVPEGPQTFTVTECKLKKKVTTDPNKPKYPYFQFSLTADGYEDCQDVIDIASLSPKSWWIVSDTLATILGKQIPPGVQVLPGWFIGRRFRALVAHETYSKNSGGTGTRAIIADRSYAPLPGMQASPAAGETPVTAPLQQPTQAGDPAAWEPPASAPVTEPAGGGFRI